MKTIKNIRVNDSECINIYTTDSTRKSEEVKFDATTEVEDSFLKTTEGKNLIKHKFIKVVPNVKIGETK